MRILLTGISGQVGATLLPLLSGHDVVAADRTTLDLARPERIGAVLDRLAPELIVNPAAYTAVDKAEDERELAMLVNARAPGALARWARRTNVPLVHFSTDYVFDGSGARPWREDDATGPLSAYGESKLAGEAAIRAAGGTFLIVRSSWVYAATGSNFLRTIVRLARERKELRIVSDQVGAPTSAAVIAEAVTAMLGDSLETFRVRCAQAGGMVHLSTRGETSWHGFATAIVDGLKTRGVKLAVEQVHAIKSEDYPTRAKRPRNSRLDLSRLQQVFGITPPPWRDALAPELDRLAQQWL
jgi:dTDP-4-dehydrorhamnose reductase